jgi:hypothetical protein
MAAGGLPEAEGVLILCEFIRKLSLLEIRVDREYLD